MLEEFLSSSWFFSAEPSEKCVFIRPHQPMCFLLSFHFAFYSRLIAKRFFPFHLFCFYFPIHPTQRRVIWLKRFTHSFRKMWAENEGKNKEKILRHRQHSTYEFPSFRVFALSPHKIFSFSQFSLLSLHVRSILWSFESQKYEFFCSAAASNDAGLWQTQVFLCATFFKTFISCCFFTWFLRTLFMALHKCERRFSTYLWSTVFLYRFFRKENIEEFMEFFSKFIFI